MDKEEHMVELSDVDRRLLNVLIENSRLSYREIAKRAKCSVTTALNHIKALEANGVIANYSVRIHYGIIGYDLQAIIDIKIAKGRLDDVERKIASHPNVSAVYDNTGSFDATVIAKFTTRRKLDAFLKKIQQYDFVQQTETKLLLSTVKEEPINV